MDGTMLLGGLDAQGTTTPLADTMLGRQIALETEAVNEGVRLYQRAAKEAIERGDGASLKPAERLMLHWVEPLAEAIRQEQRKTGTGEPGVGRAIYGPVFCAVDPMKIAVAALHEIIGRCMMASNGVTVSELAYAVGLAIIAEAQLDMLKDENRDSFEDLTARVKRLTPKKVSHWTNKNLKDPIWSRRVAAHVGSELLGLVLETATLPGPEHKPAFRHDSRISQNKTRYWFRLCWEAHRLIEEGHGIRQFMRPRYLPMIVPPLPWQQAPTGKIEGGYVHIRTPLVSKAKPSQQEAYRKADLTKTYECMKALSAPAWSVNQSINQVVAEIIERGGGVAGIPPHDDKQLPEAPGDYETLPKEVQKAWRTERAIVRHENRSLRSKRAEVNSILAVVERVQNHSEIFFPHQLDFRSRAYPVPQNLNRHGGDLARALLVFGRPVDASGERARYWLYVHAANCAGRDKLSYEDRVAWVDQWLHDSRSSEWISDCRTIVDAAADTWAAEDIDKPLQFLAAVLAIFDPAQAAVLPIQRDGTCNALQHMAGMSLDPELARLVGMMDMDKPESLYVLVAGLVSDEVNRHAADMDHPTHVEAKTIAGNVTKQLIKRPVMTRNYSVTLIGARNQISEELFELSKQRPELGLKDWKLRRKVALYLARETMKAMDRLCAGANRVMKWLTACSNAITKTGELVRWTTDLGFPVVQPYRKYRVVQIVTILQKLSLIIEDEDVPVSPKKHASAIVPNFTHSLDATHMHLVGLDCYDRDIDFGAIHDGYCVHAANVDELDIVTRERYIELYTKDRLQLQCNEWRAMYPNAKIPDPPQRGTFDLDNVRRAPYFFN